MAEEQIANSEPQKAPYVKPAILTLKVNPSFAAAPSSKWLPVPDETETRQSQAKAAVAQARAERIKPGAQD